MQVDGEELSSVVPEDKDKRRKHIGMVITKTFLVIWAIPEWDASFPSRWYRLSSSESVSTKAGRASLWAGGKEPFQAFNSVIFFCFSWSFPWKSLAPKLGTTVLCILTFGWHISKVLGLLYKFRSDIWTYTKEVISDSACLSGIFCRNSSRRWTEALSRNHFPFGGIIKFHVG